MTDQEQANLDGVMQSLRTLQVRLDDELQRHKDKNEAHASALEARDEQCMARLKAKDDERAKLQDSIAAVEKERDAIKEERDALLAESPEERKLREQQEAEMAEYVRTKQEKYKAEREALRK